MNKNPGNGANHSHSSLVMGPWGMPLVDVRQIRIDPQLVQQIPEQLAHHYRILPLASEGNKLMLGMIAPFNAFAIDDVRLITSFDIYPVQLASYGGPVPAFEELTRAIGDMPLPVCDDCPADAGATAALDQALGATYGLSLGEAIKELGPRLVEEPQPNLPLGLADVATESPIVKIGNLILSQAVKDGATHIHFEPDRKCLRVRFRVNEQVQEVMSPPKMTQFALTDYFKQLAGLDPQERAIPQLGSLELDHNGDAYHVQISTCPTAFGETLVFRLWPLTSPPPLEEFGLAQGIAEELDRLATRGPGLVLVNGPGRSGRSTITAALLARWGRRGNSTLCDADYRADLRNVNQVLLHPDRPLGESLRALLRQDVDFLGVGGPMVAEDLGFLAELSVRSLVLCHWNASNQLAATLQLKQGGVAGYRCLNALRAVLSVRLLGQLCRCKRPETDAQILASLPPTNLWYYERNGCAACRHTGVTGRVMVAEMGQQSSSLLQQALALATRGIIEGRSCQSLS